MTTDIDKIRRVPLREVWKHEALDFTSWLQDNLDVLNDQLGLFLVSAEREQSVGSFNVDLIAENSNGETVVIENQLEKTNHDHLGKVLTYLVNVGASSAIWISSDPRLEHVKTVAWLNESTNVSFYLVKVEAVRIGTSPAAPLLTLIVGPTAESRAVGETKRELAVRFEERHRFWSSLLALAKQRTKLHANISPGNDTWVSASAGRSGLTWGYTVRQHDAGVELYIDRGSEAENMAILQALEQGRAEVETIFGGPLEWESRAGRRACRIRARFGTGGYRDEARWPELQRGMVDAMLRLEQALAGRIKQLPQ